MRWGFATPTAQEPKLAPINARAETLSTSPMFRDAFRRHRCLVVADGFYEFTDPIEPKKKRKDKWLFTKRDEPIFCIAGIWRDTPEVGEAFTMLR